MKHKDLYLCTMSETHLDNPIIMQLSLLYGTTTQSTYNYIFKYTSSKKSQTNGFKTDTSVMPLLSGKCHIA